MFKAYIWTQSPHLHYYLYFNFFFPNEKWILSIFCKLGENKDSLLGEEAAKSWGILSSCLPWTKLLHTAQHFVGTQRRAEWVIRARLPHDKAPVDACLNFSWEWAFRQQRLPCQREAPSGWPFQSLLGEGPGAGRVWRDYAITGGRCLRSKVPYYVLVGAVFKEYVQTHSRIYIKSYVNCQANTISNSKSYSFLIIAVRVARLGDPASKHGKPS